MENFKINFILLQENCSECEGNSALWAQVINFILTLKVGHYPALSLAYTKGCLIHLNYIFICCYWCTNVQSYGL